MCGHQCTGSLGRPTLAAAGMTPSEGPGSLGYTPERPCTHEGGASDERSRSTTWRRGRRRAGGSRCSPPTTSPPRGSSTRRVSPCCSSATRSATTSSATRTPCRSRWRRCSTTRARSRAASTKALVVGDMPFLSYQVSVEEGVRNAGRFLKEGGAGAVKIEGRAGRARAPARRARDPRDGPRRPHAAVGARDGRLQGPGPRRRRPRLMDEALALEKAGAFAIVLEAMPAELGAELTRALRDPDDRDRRGAGTPTPRCWSSTTCSACPSGCRSSRKPTPTCAARSAGRPRLRRGRGRGTLPRRRSLVLVAARRSGPARLRPAVERADVPSATARTGERSRGAAPPAESHPGSATKRSAGPPPPRRPRCFVPEAPSP